MPSVMSDVLGKDLGGHKLVNAKFLERDHQLMGYFPAIYTDTKRPVIFLEEDLVAAAQEALGRKSKATCALFLLEPGGKSGFVVQGDDPLGGEQYKVLDRGEFNNHSATTPVIKWAPGLL